MRVINKILGLLAPDECINCGDEGSLLCFGCQESFPLLPGICYLCRRPNRDFATCNKCFTGKKPNNVWVRTVYEKNSKELVASLKFHHARQAADIVATMICEMLPLLPEDTIITHVPALNRHVRERGYDQSRLIALQVAKMTKRHYAPLLGRLGNESQTMASRVDRLRAIKGQFRPIHSYLTNNATVLLIDDVITTGATIEESTKILKTAGARVVYVAAFARAKN